MKQENIANDELNQLLNSPVVAIHPDVNRAEATFICDMHATLGECVIYDDDRNIVLWTDIDGKKFFKLDLVTTVVDTYSLPRRLAAFALRPKGEKGYLCAWESSFQLYDIENDKALSDMCVVSDICEADFQRLNDGRCDPEGRRFICGGHREDRNKGKTTAVFYCEMVSGKLLCGKLQGVDIDGGVETSNSICFSPRGDVMYFADSPKKIIWKYHYDKESGTLSNKTVLSRHKGAGVPDGSCVDNEGYIWNAVWKSGVEPGAVHRIDPTTGEIVFTVTLPDSTSQVTCCCFGAPNMDVMFISTAAVDRDTKLETNAGGLYAVKLNIKGKTESRFCY
mmetsp:Transcript_23745/g.34027  ORF Transcript_23745/g.34027 Transcript_23745/m.34027 type:complete len:336 (-) Transcript_23745:178-1185(-)